MKKIFVSTGLAAISVAGLQSVHADSSDTILPKAWSISGTLRGFYDDNYDLASTKRGSWGAELDPTISYNLPLQQTDMGIRVNYGIFYYDDRRQLLGWGHSYDQQASADLWLNHAFNERWKFSFTDTLAYGYNPLLAQNLASGPATYRVNGDNIANHAAMSLDTQWTKEFGTSLSYGNDFYNYENRGATVINNPAFPPGLYLGSTVKGNNSFGNDPTQFASLGGSGASLAGLLDRVDENVGLNLTWTFSPETMILAGYTFSWSEYYGNEPIATYNYAYFNPTTHVSTLQSYVYSSKSRDGTSHEAHVGIQHQLTANISLSATIGVEYSANDSDPFSHSDNINPTANISLSYTYSPGNYVQLGVTQSQNSTDVVQPGVNGSLTQYQNTTVVYADINHQIVHNLYATVLGRYQYSVFQGGAANQEADQQIDASINLTYNFNRHFSADFGYNFNDLLSDLVGRAFTQNQVYLGVTASY
ncbi:MAG TPA: outer membrane beta-barrel protein [Candidatus Sulfotelmatobacter sp.]|nr:outer membrane beta-barrel protein [Candidatus Sulfotelmatobacter sp.]